jgi:hypothetical protein
MKHISLLGILGIAAILNPQHIIAQNVTWSASGLPPGMSIVPINGTTANITGTPTAAGNYNPVVFPKIGNAVGDMVSFPLTVLPTGMELPTYYPYSRIPASGDYLQALAGGNGSVLLWSSQSKKLYFTTNGTNFAEVSVQTGIPSGYSRNAEFAGFRCVVKFSNPSTLFYSDNRTTFKTLAFPSDLTQNQDSAVLVSNRTNRFFLISADGNSGASAKIWSIQSNQTTWKAGSLPITGWFYNASMAANGSLLVLACSYNDDPAGLCYSTNSGDTWIKTPTNPGIVRVAYGNGLFLGSGNSGIWKSTNGIDWQKVSSNSNIRTLMFSTPENLFFSNLGVSRDGLYWAGFGDYVDGSDYNPFASSGTGLIFCRDSQLGLTKIPRLWDNSPKKATVNKPASFQIQVEQ